MEPDVEPSTSVSTIRGLRRLNTVHPDLSLDFTQSPSFSANAADDTSSLLNSRPSSPHSALPSPGSPSGDSVSSFPSVSSSFLFSSGPASPPQLHVPQSLHPEFDAEGVGLIIPSLALPSESRRPTPYGQTLGDVRLLLLAPRGADTAALVSQLLDENEDIVEVGTWEEEERGSGTSEMLAVLRASTDWIEHRDAHGLERVEPARNVEIVELPGYDPSDAVETILGTTLPIVHGPFCQVHEALSLDYAPDGVLANLLSSSSTPMYTVLVLLQTTLPTPTEKALLGALSPHIPLIVLPPFSMFPHAYSHAYPILSASRSAGQSSSAFSHCTKVHPAVSAFRPPSAAALRTGLFRSPDTLALLRREAAARFLRWREVERAVARVDAHANGPRRRSKGTMEARRAWTGHTRWDKATWEAQWEGMLSQDVAVELRRGRAETAVPPRRQSQMSERQTSDAERSATHGAVPSLSASSLAYSGAFDPLHVPSLFAFSVSLLAPLRAQLLTKLGLARSPVMEKPQGPAERRGYSVGLVGLALVGAFCAGIGLGLFVAQV